MRFLLETTVYPKRLGKPEEYAALVLHIAEKRLYERFGNPVRRRAPNGAGVTHAVE